MERLLAAVTEIILAAFEIVLSPFSMVRVLKRIQPGKA